jgi:DNA-binding NtrC family response regulator
MDSEKMPTPTVLVVDDEALIRWSLSEGLSDGGYAVRMAGSGAEARAALTEAADEPLVILLDLRLPDVSDLSLLQEIRAKRPDVPVIMMTAHGTSEDAARATALGARRFVGKPFDVGEMVQLVGTTWQQHLAEARP